MAKDGGPAFPHAARKEDKFAGHAYVDIVPAHDGMSLRDWFAGRAITKCLPGAMISDTEVFEYARMAYRMADAMLAARED